MAKAPGTRAKGPDKRQRLRTAAAQVLYEQGVERTTIADIADSAGVPIGNVYYYFKTKDDLVRAALSEHAEGLRGLTGELEELPDPFDRLQALVGGWGSQADIAARYGCPVGTLAAELGKRPDGAFDSEAADVVRLLLSWVERQFRQLGLPQPDDLALTLIAGYQGMSLIAYALRDPEIMTRETARLSQWLDTLRDLTPDGRR